MEGNRQICGLFVFNDRFTRNYTITGKTLGGGIITYFEETEDGYLVYGTPNKDYEKEKEDLLTFIPKSVNPIVEYYPKGTV